MGYHLEGDLLEVCDCRVLCPCWIGEDADNGTCDTILAYKMKKGTINGTDVTGLSLALMAHIPAQLQQAYRLQGVPGVGCKFGWRGLKRRVVHQ